MIPCITPTRPEGKSAPCKRSPRSGARRSGSRPGRRRTGCSVRALRRRCPCSRRRTSASRSGRRRACARSPRPGWRRRARRSPPESANDGQDLPARPHPGIAGGARRVTDHLHLEAELRARVEDVQQHGDADGDQETERNDDAARPAPQVERRPDRVVRHRLRLRERARLDRGNVAPVGGAVEDQLREDVPGHVVEHQRGDDLARPGERLEHAGDQPPRPRRQRRRRSPWRRSRAARTRPARAGARRAERPDRPEVELALGADVAELHAERGRGREPREQERRGGRRRSASAPPRR